MTGPVAALERARRVADTVLYEGYVLYPYRASARKNQIRWQFGVLAPRAFSEADGSEAWSSQTECVVEVGPDPEVVTAEVDVKVRFLRVQARTVEAADGDGRFCPVPSLDVDGRYLTDWDEAAEEEIDLAGLRVADLLDAEQVVPIDLVGWSELESVVDTAGRTAGRLRRERLALSGVVRVRAERVDSADLPAPLVRIRARVENLTDWCEVGAGRDDVVRRSLASVHLVLAVRGGAFVSMIDPPDGARDAVASCRNERTWPVLVGEQGQRDVVLSSPITLYDYPEIAPESEGDFCDATEIDEILALRVMTLTDEEKRQARGTDARAADIVDRCDSMPAEIFERLHGAVRSLRPTGPLDRPGPVGPARLDVALGLRDRPDLAGGPEPVDDPFSPAVPWWDPGADGLVRPYEDAVLVGPVEVRKGSRVRLQPGSRSDAQDIFLVGATAVVEGVFHDVDGDVHVAVSLDDDPASEMNGWYGRYRYFRPEELDPLDGPK